MVLGEVMSSVLVLLLYYSLWSVRFFGHSRVYPQVIFEIGWTLFSNFQNLLVSKTLFHFLVEGWRGAGARF
jgi:hypothetical protein